MSEWGGVRGKRVLITGATNGIGLEAAVELARLGARMFLVGRDPGRTAAAVEQVKARSGSGEVSSFLCDFSSQASIRALAAEVLSGLDRLDVLVNNAGGVNKERRLTVDGIEATFAVNHLGYFLLTNLLLDRIVIRRAARIVTVASIGHRRGTLDFDDLGFERGYHGVMRAYGRSKLANVLFAAELARRLAGTGVTTNALHPGAVATNIFRRLPKPIEWLIKAFTLSPEKGAETSIYLATSPEVEGVSGKYFEKKREARISAIAQDDELARRLWDESARLTGLEKAEAHYTK